MPQTTIISFFKYEGRKNKWQALERMGRSPLLKRNFQGLTFWKPLGTGSGNGFSIWPDWSTYGLLTVFETEQDAHLFLNSKAMPFTMIPTQLTVFTRVLHVLSKIFPFISFI